jgi:ferrochelatase
MATVLGPESSNPPQDFALVYSAHSLPKSMIEEGDPYVDHLQRTVRALEAETGVNGRICYQSRSGPVAWLEPGTDTLLSELAREGIRRILAVPISFVSDHVETLYEIDMLYADMMAEQGVRLYRTPSLNDRPRFVKALASLVSDRLEEAGWLV